VALAMVLTLLAVDWLLHPMVSMRILREVDDGVADLELSNPTDLVLSSSHARSFDAVGAELRRRTAGRVSLVAVPEEAGKLQSFLWVLEHRVRPILDARTAAGNYTHDRLARLTIAIQAYDTCPPPPAWHGQPWNLPSRAWTLRDFLDDVAAHGVNDYNRKFLQQKVWKVLWEHSALVQGRMNDGLKTPVARRLESALLHWNVDAIAKREQADFIERRQRAFEDDVHCIGDAGEMQAFDAILDYARMRGLRTTVILFPLMPVTVTDVTRDRSLARLRDVTAAHLEGRDVRLIDLSTRVPLTDADFMADLDHLTAHGNQVFTAWSLSHDLRFLLDDPPPAADALALRH
jgi:hypothetical protein